MAGDDARELATEHARSWIEGYGIRTQPYLSGGGDHPMMATLPDAMIRFAAVLLASRYEADLADAMVQVGKKAAVKILPVLRDYPACDDAIRAAIFAALRAARPEADVRREADPYEVLGTTYDGVQILAPKMWSKNFTREQIREAVAKALAPAPAGTVQDDRAQR